MLLRVANLLDLKQVADVHIQCFKGTFIASFGHNLVTKYYEEFFNEAPLFVVAEDENKIVGFCMGYKSGSKARSKFIRKNRLRLFFKMLILCLSLNRLAISKCFNMVKPKRKISAGCLKVIAEADLLSICVLDNYKGRGLAKKLVADFEQLLVDNDLHDYTLSVYKTNDRAIGFYKKQGLTIVSEIGDEFKMYKKISL